MEKSQVNEKYVLALVENSDTTLSVRRMDIPSSEVPIAELEAMVDNPNRTVYDMWTTSLHLLIIPLFLK